MNTLLGVVLAGGPGEWGPGWGGGWWLVFPVFWILAVATVIWLVTRDRRRSGHARPIDRAGDILAARFARGEIDVDEYHERLEALRDRST